MLEGILIKRYAGFYYVMVGDKIWECSLRGRFRKQKQDFLPGDRVCINVLDEKKGVIEEVMPRVNRLIRPPVANVEQVIVTFAFKNPDLDFLLLDRILVMVSYEKLKPVICFNKADLADQQEIENIVHVYREVGYHVLVTSKYSKVGLDDLRLVLQGKISVFAGPSGAGKSSLLNALQSGLCIKTGDVSSKIGRGRHTTRYVQLMKLDFGGLVADTPGFSALDLPPVSREHFDEYYPEIRRHADVCKFNSCLHNLEPGCSVKDAVLQGKIDSHRYQRYLYLLQKVIDNERRY